MSSLFFQPPVILFAGMMAVFAIVLGYVAIEDALRR